MGLPQLPSHARAVRFRKQKIMARRCAVAALFRLHLGPNLAQNTLR
jgi:hypothetical protein